MPLLAKTFIVISAICDVFLAVLQQRQRGNNHCQD